MPPLVFYGSEELKQEWLPKFATAEVIGAYALTETGSGSDALEQNNCRFEEDGKEYIINGSKMRITNAASWTSSPFLRRLTARSSLTLVPANTPALSIGAEEHKMGILRPSTCALAR